MTRLLHRHLLDEAPPVEPLRPVPATTRRPLHIDEQARSIAALAGIRSEAPVLDLRVANGLGMHRPAAPQPAITFFAHYTEDLRVGMEMRNSLQYIGGVLFESDDALDAIIVKALAPILSELAELAPFTAKAGC